jgi:hypothetical protein
MSSQARTIVIPLADENRTQHGALYVGPRRRLAGATGVKFVDQHRLLYASLVGKRLYLAHLDWEHGTYAVVAAVDEPFTTDLLDFDGNDLIVTSNCEARSVSFYRLVETEIRHTRDLPIRDPGAGHCHGARFVPGRPDLVCATCNSNGHLVYFLAAATGQVVYSFRHAANPKDVAFVDASRAVVLYTEGQITPEKTSPYRSKAVLMRVDIDRRKHHVLSEVVVDGHVDSCFYVGGKLYINDQSRDVIHRYTLVGDVLVPERKFSGYTLPHGVDALPTDDGTLLAVASYGSNDVNIQRVS